MPTEQKYVTPGQKYVTLGCIPGVLERPPSELDNLFPEGVENINLAKIGRAQTKMAGTR